MKISDWQVFLTIENYRSINLAAEKLNLSQSGTSYILKTLEEQTGFPLFIRSPKGVTLTKEGELILKPVQQLVKQASELSKQCKRINGLSEGILRIGTFASLATSILPAIIERFNADYPNIKIEVIEGSSSNVENNLLKRNIDLAFTSYRKRPEYLWLDLVHDYLKAIIPESEGSLVGENVPLQYFETSPVINSDSDYEYDVSRVLKDMDIKLQNIILTSKDEATILALVRQDLGASLLFEKVIATQNTEGVLVRNTNPILYRRLGVAYSAKNDLSPATKQFIEYIKAAVTKHNE